MTSKDYYKVLGLSDNADTATIKKTYRCLAKECHPDAHPGDKRAEARFKEISEAYDVLSDPAKRKKYDQMRKFGFVNGRQGGFNQPGFDFDFNDLFGNPRRGGRRSQRAGDFDLDDLFGFGGLGDLFGQIFDRHAGHRRSSNNGYNPNDINATVEIPFETAVLGGKTVFSLAEKDSKQFSVNIPAGVQDGKKLRLTGHGQTSANGLPPGDLILTLRVPEHRFFKIKGLDIFCEIPIEKKKAKKGTRLRVKTIMKTTVELKIPPGTTEEKTFRLQGLGVKGKNEQGDQYVTIKLVD